MNVLLIYLVEMVGTFILFSIGQAVTAGTILTGSKNDKKFINICLGWGAAIFLSTVISLNIGHLNPALSIGMLIANPNITVMKTLHHIIGQFVGTFLAQLVVVIKYWNFIKNEKNPDIVLGIFSTRPNDYAKKTSNFISITLSSTIYFIVVYGLVMVTNFKGVGAVSSSINSGDLTIIEGNDITMFITFIFFIATCKGIALFGIGISLTGSVGFTINPFRDLVPRLMHQLWWRLKNRGSSYWLYGLQPILIPFIPSSILAVALKALVEKGIVIFG